MRSFKLLLATTVLMVANVFAITIYSNTSVPWTSITGYHTSDIIIEADAQLVITGCIIDFAPNAGIFIEDGGQLILNGTTLQLFDPLQNSTDRWKGIEVEDNLVGTSSMYGEIAVEANGSFIYDAKKGVYNRQITNGLTTGKGLMFNGCTFRDNDVSARLEYSSNNYSNGLDNNIIYYNCNFEGEVKYQPGWTGNLIFMNANNIVVTESDFQSYFAGSSTNTASIWSNQNQNLKVTNNYFHHKFRLSLTTDSYFRHLTVDDNVFEAQDYYPFSWNSFFSYKAITLMSPDSRAIPSLISIQDNEFTSQGSCPYNTLGVQFFVTAKDIKVIGNEFQNMDKGFLLTTPSAGNSNFEIRKNTFSNYSDYALKLDDNPFSGMEITCNVFNEGNRAIYIDGDGLHPSSNLFANYFNGANIDIYYTSTTTLIYNVIVGTTHIPTTITGFGAPNVYINPLTPSPFELKSCLEIRPAKLAEIKSAPQLLNNNGEITLVNLANNTNITIVNALGQVVGNLNTTNSEIQIETAQYNTGVYFVNLDNGETQTSLKFIK